MYYISFPGLGIEPFHIDRTVTIPLINVDVAWYGILITCGMILAVLWAMHMIKSEKNLTSDDIIDLAFVAIVCGVLGARLYYVIFTWNEFPYLVTGGSFFKNLFGTLYNVIAIWNGGLAIYGGVLAGSLGAIVFAKAKRVHPFKIFDILAPSVLIGQIIGRWGNFINIEAYGGETDLPWRMGILYRIGNSDTFAIEKYVHPTFLYESLWNLVALIFIMLTFKKKKFDGQILCIYMIWYGFGRMLIEGLRTDSLMLGPMRVSQIVGLLSCAAGIILFAFLLKKSKVKAASPKDEEYVPTFEKLTETSASETTVLDDTKTDMNEESGESNDTEEETNNTHNEKGE